MKKVKYPARVNVEFQKEDGKKLDEIAIKERCGRGGAVLKAIDFYYASMINIPKAEVSPEKTRRPA